MKGSKENYQWDLGSVGVDVNFRALEKSIWVLEKSSGNLFLKKGTNPVSSREEKLQDGDPIQVTSHLHQYNSNSEKRTLTTSRQCFFKIVFIRFMYQSNRSFNIPPGQSPGHLNFWKIFGKSPPSRGRKAVQMPHHRSIPGDQIPPPPGNFSVAFIMLRKLCM